MMKLLVLAVGIGWGLWWTAALYRGPMMKESVEYMATEWEFGKQQVTHSTAAQKAYQRAVKTPAPAGTWLSQTRQQRGTWQWWAIALGPLAAAVVYAFRQP